MNCHSYCVLHICLEKSVSLCIKIFHENLGLKLHPCILNISVLAASAEAFCDIQSSMLDNNGISYCVSSSLNKIKFIFFSHILEICNIFQINSVFRTTVLLASFPCISRILKNQQKKSQNYTKRNPTKLVKGFTSSFLKLAILSLK